MVVIHHSFWCLQTETATLTGKKHAGAAREGLVEPTSAKARSTIKNCCPRVIMVSAANLS